MSWKAPIKLRLSSFAGHVFLLYAEMIPILPALRLPTPLKMARAEIPITILLRLLVYPGENAIKKHDLNKQNKAEYKLGPVPGKTKEPLLHMSQSLLLIYWQNGPLQRAFGGTHMPESTPMPPVSSQVPGSFPLTVHTYGKLATHQALGSNLSAM